MKTCLGMIVAGAAALMLAGLGSVFAQQAPPTRPSFREHYGVLSDRNIFLRERGRSSRDRNEPSSRPAGPPRSPEQSFVLTGIVFEGDEFYAYLENESGSTQTLRVGDPVARGVISQIQIDAIEYDSGGRRGWVEIGRRLTGEVAGPRGGAGSSSGSDATSQPSPGPLPNPNDPNLTIEQRMRLRRAQEMNRG